MNSLMNQLMNHHSPPHFHDLEKGAAPARILQLPGGERLNQKEEQGRVNDGD